MPSNSRVFFFRAFELSHFFAFDTLSETDSMAKKPTDKTAEE